jgi:DNA-binding transcriptional LysR family regulator
MRLRHIEIFQAIRQTGSVSAAAQLLHVSQPAVSKVLQHAEMQRLGFPLFLRVRGKLQPTPEALLLEREVDKVTESVQGVQRLAAKPAPHSRGIVCASAARRRWRCRCCRR